MLATRAWKPRMVILQFSFQERGIKTTVVRPMPQLLKTDRPGLWRGDSMEPLGETDQALDTLWRGLYGEPLPLRGASSLALRIILETERPSCPYESTAIAQPGGSRRLRFLSA